MSGTLKLNGVAYTLEICRGKPRINGLTSAAFIKKMTRDGKTAELRDILTLAVSLTVPSMMAPKKK